MANKSLENPKHNFLFPEYVSRLSHTHLYRQASTPLLHITSLKPIVHSFYFFGCQLFAVYFRCICGLGFLIGGWHYLKGSL